MKITILAIAIFLIPFGISNAAGVQVSPAKIKIELTENKIGEVKIVVFNPTGDVQLFKAYSDDFPQNVVITPASFVLDAGARKELQVKINFLSEKFSSGIIQTHLSVVGKSLANTNFETGTGVKIPLEISYDSKPPMFTKKSSSVFIGLALLSLLLLTCLMNRRPLDTNK